LTSGIISVFVWYYFRSINCAIISFASGVLIDLDHLVDYYTSHDFTFRVKSIYSACIRLDLDRLYLVLHSYELIALLWFSIYLFSLPDVWKAVAIGFTQHLIFDQITNPFNPFGYFMTYRATKGFDTKLLLEEAGK